MALKTNSDPTVDAVTIVEILRWRAARQPERRAYTFLVDGETEEVHLTYQELDRQARAIGAWLQSLGANGERILLLYPPGLEYIIAIWGCLYAGAVAVPAYPPRPNQPSPRLQAIVADAQVKLTLTTTSIRAGLDRQLVHAPNPEALRWLTTDNVLADWKTGWQEPIASRNALAILQYTSGSTSTPKGVMLTHGNLLHNLAAIRHGFQVQAQDKAVVWLPVYHDMGLIGGILATVYTGIPCIFMSPASFLQRPARWLEAFTRHQGTIGGAPNFAYGLCIDKITPEQRANLDLSSWRLAFCGAEPISKETLDRFAETFAARGFRREAFYPCYGLAEAALIVSGGLGPASPVIYTIRKAALARNQVIAASTNEPGAHSLVGCGQALLGQKIAIVNPETTNRCLPGRVGEIWVSGPSVALGYWNQPEATKQTFQAHLKTGEGPFLRTGDLGFLHNGELFVTGRLKDLIIIHGRNYYPRDIELAVEQSHAALQPNCGAAFSVEVANEEQLVVAQEVRRSHLRNLSVDEVVGAIREAIAETYDLPVYAVVLLKTRSIPKTSSGKIQRHACRAKFLEGSLEIVGEWRAAATAHATIAPQLVPEDRAISKETADMPRPSEAEIKAWLIAQIAGQLRIDPNEIDVRRPFAYFGLSSLQAVSLTLELEAWLGRRLSPTLAYDYPNVEALARHLTSETWASMESEALATTTLVGGDHEIEPEPIAIIGMSCRFPGARDPKAFWQLLRNGVDAITQVPAERQELCAFYDRNTMIPDEMPPRWGGFLEQIDQFDPRFFSISPREAARIDPQQRLLLEVSWEALEDAGQAMERLGGTRTGVFVGISSNDYGQLLLLDPGFSDPYAGTGNALSIAANRLSYVFDFRGPSMAIDTACSSSLVAVHLACQSLRRGECALALAGGVNLVLSPVITANFTKAGFMAPDGRCKAFDARANGYVRGEGVGVVILKPLSKALADGDLIYAVIRGSAVNNDGRTNGLTAPSRQAQEAVLREACQRAKILPGQIQYIEAHGTGTALGDPIEAEALGAVLAIDRSPKNFCAVGSVKTNIGHLEAAAGIAGLIKTALALKHREIPPNLHFQEPNLYIPFDKLRLRVQQRLSPWPEGPGPALAGVSSFGFGGANAHVILEEAPGKWQGANGNEQEARDEKQILQITEQVAGEHSRFATSHLPLAICHLLPLSAHSPEALQSLARAYLDFLAAEPPESATLLPDICYSAGVRRSHHDHRLTVVAHTKAEVVESLQAFLQGESRPGVATGCNHPNQRSQLVFVFCGQGPQWWAMGRELLMQEPVFHSALEDCDRLLGQCAAWSLLEEFHADESHSRLNETEIAQPALFALQIALAALWRYWGVVPDVVVGHSVGEVAAAHLAGALSLEDAVRVVFHRGRLMQRATGQGKMATVELSPEEAKQAIAAYENRLSIAAINSPTSTVLSGDPHALAAVLESLRKQEILCRELPVDYAFHSAQMEPFQSDLEQALQGLEAHPVSAPIFSTVTGQAGNGRDFDAAYWQRQIRQPVRFAAAIDSLVEEGRRLFLEIGPHPVLAVAITQCLRHRGQEGAALPSLRRGEEERAVMLGSLGALYAQGCPLDWRRLYPAGGRYVQLPFYPWQRERCWIETEEADPWLNRWRAGGDQSDVRRHPLLGRPVKLAHLSEGYFWENQLNRRLLPYLADHRFQGAVLLPGTAYLEMAIAAAVEAFGAGSHTLTGVELRSPLFLSENSSYTVQLILSPDTGGEVSFRIFSRPGGEEQADGSWTLHALGKINRDANDSDSRLMEPTGPKQLQERCPEEISGEHCYLELREKGLEYGPRFQGLKQLWRCKGEALGLVQLPQVLESELEAYHLHPALLDACAQVLVAADSNNDRLLVPVGVNKVRFYKRPGARLWSHAQLEPEGEQPENEIVGDIRLLDEAGDVVAEALGLRLQSLDGNIQRVAPANPDDWIYLLQWQPEPHPEAGRASQPTVPSSSGTWLIFADKEGVGEALAALLAEAGERHVLVSPGSTYERVDGGHFRICPARLEYIRQLFNDVFGDGQPPCRGVVHLWGLDTLPLEEITAASLEAEQRPGCGTVVSLVQEMVRTEWSEPPRLWLVTRGTQAVEGSPNPPTVSQATLWGLGRTIAQEQPAIWGGLIDLEPGALVDHDGSLLWQEVSNPDGENQLAFRQGERYVARLVRKPKFKDRDAALQWRPDGSYLITGGLGGLGFLVARWMVEQGARRLILLGRTQLPPRAEWDQVEKGSRLAGQIAAIRKLEFLGASVHIASVDVSDEAQLAAFLDTFRREGWPPIRGVVHAAGVLQDQILLRLDPTAMAAVFRAKVIGGWLLHRLFEDTPLDFFVLFSSAASLLGSPGQGNYAAANAFLDALAHHRHAQGKSALSINWGPWAEAGMAAQPNRGERLARQGIGSIQPEQGLELLGRLLRQDAIQVGVIPINWTQLFRSFSELRELPLLTQLAKESAAASPETDSARENEGLARKAILAAEPDQRQKLLESALCEQVARVVGLSASKLDVRQPLNTLGIDSLMGVELKIRVETELGVVVPAVKLLEGPSIAELATLLLRQISATPTAPQESAVEHAASSRRPQIVEIQPAGSKPPFFCVHPGALDVRCYSDLARYLGDEQPFYALQPIELDNYRSLDGEPVANTSIAEVAGRCIAELRSIQPQGPYLLGGWSLGGIVAFEMAQQLQKQGEKVALLALFDSPTPSSGDRPTDHDDADVMPMFASYLGARRRKKLPLSRDALGKLELNEQFNLVLEQAKMAEVLPPEAGLSQIRALFEVYKNGLRIGTRQLQSYKSQVYTKRIIYFRANDVFEDVLPDATPDWKKLTSESLEIHIVPGDHYTMFLEPYVRVLAQRLDECLDMIQSGRSTSRKISSLIALAGNS